MRLIKLGQTILNMELVTRLEDFSYPIPGGPTSPGPIRVEFDAGHYVDVAQYADELRTWLATNMTDLTPVPTP